MTVTQQANSGGKKKIFIPRLECPDFQDPNYLNTAYGGKNICIIPDMAPVPGSVLPNCVGYAWGRFMEILGKVPTLCAGDAGVWYGWEYDGYERGNKAQVGAVICWSQPGKWGHVAIVEEIHPDGSITVSQSGYNYKNFWTQDIPADYSLPGYVFQGFIYNPACDAMQTAFNAFMDTLIDTEGDNGDKIRSKYNLSKTDNWNVLYIAYCAGKAGLKKLVPVRKSASDFVSACISKYNATWHDGPQLKDTSYTPKPGDIICLVSDSNKNKSNKYYTDRVAVVAKDTHRVNDRMDIYVIEGDVSNKVKRKIYTSTTTLIRGYLELDWNRVNSSRSGSIYLEGELYDETNDSDDAVMREVAFYSKDKPLINKTDIRLSVINYTSQLAAIVKYFGRYASSNGYYDDDEIVGDIIFNNPMTYNNETSQCLQTNGSKIFNEFMRQGIVASAAIGIMGYMWSESRWDPSSVNMWENLPNEYRGRGLCQWSLGRSVSLVHDLPDWKTNLTGQVRYCVNDMKVNFPRMYEYLQNLRNTEEDAYKAAVQFSLSFGAGYGFVPADEMDSMIARWKTEYASIAWQHRTEAAVHMWKNNITSLVKPKDSNKSRS